MLGESPEPAPGPSLGRARLLRGHSKRTGWSLAVLSAVAIDGWLNRRGCSGSSGLDQRVVAAVNL